MIVLKIVGWIFVLAGVCAAGLVATMAFFNFDLLAFDTSFPASLVFIFFILWLALFQLAVVSGLIAAGLMAIATRLTAKQEISPLIPVGVGGIVLFVSARRSSMHHWFDAR